MRTFCCTRCGWNVHFENSSCLNCGSVLGFDPDAMSIKALEPAPGTPKQGAPETWTIAGDTTGPVARLCANSAFGTCNWLCHADDPGTLCRSCALNRTIPDLSAPDQRNAWHAIEAAKKRLVYSLLRFGLPFAGTPDVSPLAFDIMRNVSTSHFDGVITIDVAEADDVERERRRTFFHEPYRSLLGHFRHESAHYFWPLLVERAGFIDEFRSLFGDERTDYATALERHHGNGPAPDWQLSYVSAYASSHPWEDWAETWAHYFHIVETIDTAETEGIEPRARGIIYGSAWPFKSYDVYRERSVDTLMQRWIPLTAALNELSRSMGHADFYPFVTPANAYPRFAFVERVIRAAAA